MWDFFSLSSKHHSYVSGNKQSESKSQLNLFSWSSFHYQHGNTMSDCKNKQINKNKAAVLVQNLFFFFFSKWLCLNFKYFIDFFPTAIFLV